jgi:hypothetical protein
MKIKTDRDWLHEIGFNPDEATLLLRLADSKGIHIAAMTRQALRIYHDSFQPRPPALSIPGGCMGDDNMVPPEARP